MMERDINYDGMLLEHRIDITKVVSRFWKISLAIFILGWILVPFIYALILPIASGLFFLLSMSYSSIFNGYKLTETELILYFDNLFYHRKLAIKLKTIKSISYNEIGRSGPLMIYNTSMGEFRSYVPNGIFSFAKILKFLKYEKGIDVAVGGWGDYEIEMYLKNKIDKVPVENIPDN